jgi:hypothetical protein
MLNIMIQVSPKTDTDGKPSQFATTAEALEAISRAFSAWWTLNAIRVEPAAAPALSALEAYNAGFSDALDKATAELDKAFGAASEPSNA